MIITKTKGFTLAEVLITLGIIGVVSALTIPTLVKRNTNEAFVQQLKKAYATISTAFDSILAENNVVNIGETYAYDEPGKFLNNYFKVAVDCGTQRGKPCFADSYKQLNGDTMSVTDMQNAGNTYSVVLADGTAIAMAPMYNLDSWQVPASHNIYIHIDTNGSKGPNIIGRDFFTLKYDDSKKMLQDLGGYNGDAVGADRNQALNYCSNSQRGYGCLRLIQIDGWKMDY